MESRVLINEVNIDDSLFTRLITYMIKNETQWWIFHILVIGKLCVWDVSIKQWYLFFCVNRTFLYWLVRSFYNSHSIILYTKIRTDAHFKGALFSPSCDDVIKWKHFPRYWPFVRGIHRWPVNSPHKGQWRGALMFSLICDWINGWVSNREAGDLRRHRTHNDVIVMVHYSSPSWEAV